MTKDEINEIVDKEINGQGNQVGIAKGLGMVLKALAEGAGGGTNIRFEGEYESLSNDIVRQAKAGDMLSSSDYTGVVLAAPIDEGYSPSILVLWVYGVSVHSHPVIQIGAYSTDSEGAIADYSVFGSVKYFAVE